MRDDIDYAGLRVDKAADEPLHLQLGRELRRQLRLLKPKSQANLLSERKLSELLALDRSTTHRTYADLRKDGLVEAGPNKTLRVVANARHKLRQPFPTIGIIIPERFSEFIDINRQIPLRYIKGIVDRTAELNISTLMVQLPAADSDADHIGDFVEDVVGRLAGVIHLGARLHDPDPPLQAVLESTDVPQVMVSAFNSYPHIGSVTGDVRAGGQSLCEHLREMGHVDVGVVSYLPNARFDGVSRYLQYESESRIDALLKLFGRYRLTCAPAWQIYSCDARDGDGRAMMEKRLDALLRAGNLPTAFCCINDEVAAHWIAALEARGLRVPGDVSVVGYDGDTHAGHGDALTTVRLPFYAIGCRAVDLLQEYNDHGLTGANREARVATSLVLGDTLGRAARKPVREPAGERLAAVGAGGE